LAPEFTVEINIKGGGTVILKVGEDNPIGDSRFATDSSGKKVVLIPKKITYTIDKDLKDLRNKRLFSYDTEKTQEIEILKKGKRLVLKKEGEKWFVVSGKEKKEADDMKVTRIVSGLNVLQVKEFEHEAPADLKKYGLSTPKGMVTVRDDKTTQLHLLIGNGDKDGVFVSKKAEKPVYKVAKSILKRLETDPSF
jgi:hypothetical protein